MNLVKIDYNRMMEDEIANFSNEKKPTLLLHSCCGPCSTTCLERLIEFFDVTIYFYNPNIQPKEEFDLRLESQKKFLSNCKKMKNVNLVVPEYNTNEFLNFIDLQNFPERKHERECGSRCSECYLLRLSATANYACKNNFDYWTTTLTVSPHKDSRLINEIGFELSKSDLYNNSKYLPSDFKKKNGYQRSIQLSKEYELYRQNYCGCIFGKLADENFIKSKEENNYGNS